jgi:hypothetical protein
MEAGTEKGAGVAARLRGFVRSADPTGRRAGSDAQSTNAPLGEPHEICGVR